MFMVTNIQLKFSPLQCTVADTFSLQYARQRYAQKALTDLTTDVEGRIQAIVKDAVILDGAVLLSALDLAEFIFQTLQDDSPAAGFFVDTPSASPEGVVAVQLSLRAPGAPEAARSDDQLHSATRKRKRAKSSSELLLTALFTKQVSLWSASTVEHSGAGAHISNRGTNLNNQLRPYTLQVRTSMQDLANKYMAQTADGFFVSKRERVRDGVAFSGAAEMYVVAKVLDEMGGAVWEQEKPVQFVQTQLLR